MAVQPRLDLGRYIGKFRGQGGDNFLALAFQEIQDKFNRLLPTTVTTEAAPSVVTAAASGPAATPTQPSPSVLSVNGFALTKGNLNQLSPPAPSGFVTGTWQVDPVTQAVTVSLPLPTLVPVAAFVDTGPVTINQTGNLQFGGGIAPAGLYEVKTYMEVTIANAAGSLDISIGWQDDVAARTATNGTNGMPADISTAATNFAQGSTVIRADGVHNITYTFTIVQTTGTATYRGFAALERLN